MPDRPQDHPAILAAFLDRYLADARAGRVASRDEYRALFPDHAELVGEEFDRLQEQEAGPERIGHYSLLRELGRGGQGAVFLARDERLGREVALKLIPDQGPLSARALARFRREAEITAKLDHPNICTVLDSGRADGFVYIAMRFVDGESLGDRVRRVRDDDRAREELRSRATILETVRLFERIARAVHEAHRAGVVHRDLKPANIMLSRHGDPVVLDFGLARDDERAPGDPELTRTGEVFGTPWYMSPEQLRGDSGIDARTDVYSLGASLYECLTGNRPIEAASREALYQAILDAPIRDPRQHNPKLPRDLCAVLTIALDKDPDRRYATAEAFADDLRRIAELEPIVARPPSLGLRGWRWVQRNRTVATLSLLLFAALTTGLFVSMSALRDSEDARTELRAALDDILAGKERKLQLEIEAKLLEAYQAAYSADPRSAPRLFEEVLALDPSNVDALAGRVWLELGRPARALGLLDNYGSGMPAETVAWMRTFVGGERNPPTDADDPDSLRLYWAGLDRIGGFERPVPPEDARAAFDLFRRAALRSDRPRFHHHHSMLMTASRLGDRALLEACADDLEHLWPDAPATHEAIAQFFLPIDRARAVRSLHRLTETTRSATPYCGLAYAAMLDGETDRALEWFDRGIEVDPTFATIWFMRGQLRARLGDATGACADFEGALRADPEFAPARAALDASSKK
ncbi:MAG: protein kinase [Planctomycetes bacterium]|nr:protein kinase [Planctomycetota bacterium]